METCTLELHPTKKVHIALFQNVKNAPELRQRLINQDNTLACSLINAKLVYLYAQKRKKEKKKKHVFIYYIYRPSTNYTSSWL